MAIISLISFFQSVKLNSFRYGSINNSYMQRLMNICWHPCHYAVMSSSFGEHSKGFPRRFKGRKSNLCCISNWSCQ